MDTNININTKSGSNNNSPEYEVLKFVFYFTLFTIASFYLIPVINAIGFLKVLFIYIACSVVKETLVYVFE